MTAFKIVHNFQTLTGRKYRVNDYYEARTEVEEAELTKAQYAMPLAADTPKPKPTPPPVVDTPPEDEGDADPSKPVAEEPDWSYMTIKAMRSWLDASETEIPASPRGKTPHEELCQAAYAGGARPHPLYGFPGGPEVAPGLPGPDAGDPEAFRAAIDAASEAGVAVPPDTFTAYKALTAPKRPTTIGPPTGTAPEPQETPVPAGDATISDDAAEPVGSINDAPTDAPTDDLDPAAADPAGEPTTVLPEGETEHPVTSAATADTPATREE